MEVSGDEKRKYCLMAIAAGAGKVCTAVVTPGGDGKVYVMPGGRGNNGF